MTLAIEQELEDTRKELWAARQMLGQVLLTVGEPVFVDKDTMVKHLPEGARIVVDDNIEAGAFVFYVEVPDETE